MTITNLICLSQSNYEFVKSTNMKPFCRTTKLFKLFNAVQAGILFKSEFTFMVSAHLKCPKGQSFLPCKLQGLQVKASAV